MRDRAAALEERDFMRRLWAKDASLWSDDPDVQERVRQRLGWLDVVEKMAVEWRSAGGLDERIGTDEVEQAVLLGMGGSSLCAEVCRRVFGVDGFTVLDSTVPAAVRRVGGKVDPARTLMIVSSKSGTTTETRVLADHFYARAAPMLARPGERFVAITDAGTALEELAGERDFRRLWRNAADIGGRYSALSYFGLVPMAVMGIDVEALLERALQMARSCGPEVPAIDNQGAMLGLTLHGAWEEGRDKLTFLADARLEAFGMWVEQLVAESTGKAGKGLVPVRGEPPGAVSSYGADRLFVHLGCREGNGSVAGDAGGGDVAHLADELAAAGHPVVRLALDGPYDLGQEFFRWEMAVAVAGALMQIDPFDEPDVGESKDRTRRLLEVHEERGALPEPRPVFDAGGLTLFADLDADEELAGNAAGGKELTGWLRAHLGRVEPPDYLALQAFLEPDDGLEARLGGLRARLRDTLGVATTFGWGPRYLHSTGQLHKGGPDTGVFVLITADDAEDVDCPARPYSFGTLARAQALGDVEALQGRGRRVLRVHLKEAPGRDLERLLEAFDEALAP